MGDKKGFLFLTDASSGNLYGSIFSRQRMTKNRLPSLTNHRVKMS
jgi:hypothetical protein